MKKTPAAGHIHAKNGFVEHVGTLFGFAGTLRGRPLIFFFLMDNQAGKKPEISHSPAWFGGGVVLWDLKKAGGRRGGGPAIFMQRPVLSSMCARFPALPIRSAGGA